MKKQKIQENPNHHMGKSTGYELIDGLYHIAPAYTIAFEKLSDRARGIDQLLKSVTIHATEINREIAEEQREIWKRLTDDLGLDIKKHWQYSQGTISELAEKPPQK